MIDIIESMHVLILDLDATHHALCLVFNELALSTTNERRRFNRCASHIARATELIELIVDESRKAANVAVKSA